jgi:hypothetical protein
LPDDQPFAVSGFHSEPFGTRRYNVPGPFFTAQTTVVLP